MYLFVFSFLCLTPHAFISSFFFFNDTATTEIYTLSLHDALPISNPKAEAPAPLVLDGDGLTLVALKLDEGQPIARSEEHTSELQSRLHLVCRLLLEKKKKKTKRIHSTRVTYHAAQLKIPTYRVTL